MIYRNATIEDIPAIAELQERYHVSTIKEEDKAGGFVTTLFTDQQFKELIEEENGVAIACDGDKVVAYVMAGSWKFWSAWPLFEHMIKDLPNTEYLGQVLTTENSYQYGPVCIDKEYRNMDVLPNIFEYSRIEFSKRYPILITFINQINGRSYNAHVNKLHMEVIKPFVLNNNNYYELGYDTSKKTPGSK